MKEYHVSIDGKRYTGSREEILKWRDEGRVRFDTPVWNADTQQWINLNRHPSFAATQKKPDSKRGVSDLLLIPTAFLIVAVLGVVALLVYGMYESFREKKQQQVISEDADRVWSEDGEKGRQLSQSGRWKEAAEIWSGIETAQSAAQNTGRIEEARYWRAMALAGMGMQSDAVEVLSNLSHQTKFDSWYQQNSKILTEGNLSPEIVQSLVDRSNQLRTLRGTLREAVREEKTTREAFDKARDLQSLVKSLIDGVEEVRWLTARLDAYPSFIASADRAAAPIFEREVDTEQKRLDRVNAERAENYGTLLAFGVEGEINTLNPELTDLRNRAMSVMGDYLRCPDARTVWEVDEDCTRSDKEKNVQAVNTLWANLDSFVVDLSWKVDRAEARRLELEIDEKHLLASSPPTKHDGLWISEDDLLFLAGDGSGSMSFNDQDRSFRCTITHKTLEDELYVFFKEDCEMTWPILTKSKLVGSQLVMTLPEDLGTVTWYATRRSDEMGVMAPTVEGEIQ